MSEDYFMGGAEYGMRMVTLRGMRCISGENCMTNLNIGGRMVNSCTFTSVNETSYREDFRNGTRTDNNRRNVDMCEESYMVGIEHGIPTDN
jgi:hypothetical protein